MWRRLMTYVDKMRVKQKLLGFYIVVIVMPIMLVGIYLSTGIRQNMIDTKLKDVELSSQKVQTDLANIFVTVLRVSDWIAQDPNLPLLVTPTYQETYDVYEAYNKFPVFDDYLKYYSEIENIRFIVTNPTLLTNSNVIQLTSEIEASSWYQEAVDHQGQLTWQLIQDSITQTEHLGLVRSVYHNDQLLGGLTIYVSDFLLSQVMNTSTNNEFLILNQQQLVHQSDHNSLVFEAFQEPLIVTLKQNSSQAESASLIKWEKQDYHVLTGNVTLQMSLLSPLSLVTVTSKQIIGQEVTQLMLTSYLIILGIFSVSLIVIIFFVNSFDFRIKQLKKSMNYVATGDFNIPKYIQGSDEISEVYEQLYVTMESLKALIETNYDHELRAKNLLIKQRDSELNRLASQINPHFLYNTLEMIRMKALKNQDPEVAEIIKLLSKLMRKSFEKNEEEVKLTDEIAFIEMYLAIQKLRFGERISYDIYATINYENYLIMPLILQPLVENAFVHGIEMKTNSGHIQVNIRESEYLEIEIIDDGIGIPSTRLRQLRAELKDHTSMRVGMINVQQRLQLYYGDDYGIEIESIEGIGTKVLVLLPLERSKEDANNHDY